MKLLDRYVGAVCVLAMLVALFALTMLDALFAFVAEIPDIGQAGYGSLQAFSYVILNVPGRVYELFPMAALLGAVLALGGMAVSSELVAFRAAGVSRQRIGATALGACGLLLIPVMLLGEFVAPVSDRAAEGLRLNSQGRDLSVGGEAGFWARQGDAIIHAERLLESGALAQVLVYQFDSNRALRAVTTASLARPVDDHWLLSDLARTELSGGHATTLHRQTVRWDKLVEPDLLRVAAMEPANLSLRQLTRFVMHLNENGLDAYRYQQSLWSKVFYPLTALALVCAGLPFVFGAVRQGGFGQRLFIGVVIGLSFYLLTRTLGRLGDVYNLDPLWVTLLPPLLLAAAALAYLRKTFA